MKITWGATFQQIFVWEHGEKPSLGIHALTRNCFIIEINVIARVTLFFFITMLNQGHALTTQIKDALFVRREIIELIFSNVMKARTRNGEIAL